MENGENILDAIFKEDNLDDVEMIDVEEGELVEQKPHDSQNASAENGVVEADSKKPQSKNRRKRKKKKGLATGAVDINRFVIDTCRRLKEKKSYMVDAIRACGGQKTADGRRFRNGGGVLWSIIKDREANAYKEIMKKAKEFEKQFKQPSVKQPPLQKKKDSSQGEASTFASGKQGNVSDNPFASLQMQDQHEPSGSEEKRNSVHDRIRIPVSYDDDLLGLSVDKGTT